MAHASANHFEVRALPMTESPSIVLVVDDDISVRESLELLLRHEGWRWRRSFPRRNFSAAHP
jgi:FixJ family two-component response regulator